MKIDIVASAASVKNENFEVVVAVRLGSVVMRQRIELHHVDGLNVFFYKIVNGDHLFR